MTKFFKNFKKKKLFWGHFDPFLPKFGQKLFAWKKGLCHVLNIPIIYHYGKNQKKLMSYSWEKCQTDGTTDKRTDSTDRQIDFIGASARRGSNNSVMFNWNSKVSPLGHNLYRFEDFIAIIITKTIKHFY